MGGLPDLEVVDVSHETAEPSAGESIEFEVWVKNTGETTAETVETRVFVDGPWFIQYLKDFETTVVPVR